LLAVDPDPSRERSVADVLALLGERASASRRDQLGPRYGIHADHALGVAMADMKVVAREVGPNHDLAEGLWASGVYEARIVASMVDEPAKVTPGQMDRWCADFDNWAICDTVCFKLFDRAPDAWAMLAPWAGRPETFVKRGAFALLWSLALHDKNATDDAFVLALELAERESSDERRMVTKGISMALKAVGTRNAALRDVTLEAALRMAEGPSGPARSIGRNTLRELGKSS
jgi:3-methyladenine DNA glycosylase AlkD